MADAPPLMTEDAVWAAIDRERLELADLLDDLTDDEWGRPSLCSGWRIGDVAAHLALARTGWGRAAVDLARARGNVDRMIRDSAVRHASLPRRHITQQIRSMAGSRRHAPAVTPLEPLLDVLVHGQDIAVPLGRVRTMPPDSATVAAARVWTMGWPLSTAFHARRRLRGLRLVATDTGWTAGDGAVVEGPVEALLLLLTGRTAWLHRLSGPGVDSLGAPGR
ncbi:maleylpyruvate isomerase family mycothiol-dependent enzyme [Blastococcus tunisiensis]|uniref:TIGR03083 family protein n=1 Tax=Blastococcus tunisiensis TaxID=1798228 RepID=A0A1I2CH62_9ACTN|nr:maleylpyruvate isomerase family mycothiol-dependent enzyme [Blastococcus sp. DSM 46838]SFE67482.1 TIGR03083 family protein [Blastococcus sp. DSM 46838]